MPPLPETHRRHSLRLKGYDYSLAGAYYVTLCTHGRMSLFGEVVGGAMRTNPAGDMVTRWWAELARKFPGVIPDIHVVMPNHSHGVIIITHDPVGADLRVRPSLARVRPPLSHVRPGLCDAARGEGDSTARDAGTGDVGGHTGPPLPDRCVGADLRVCPGPQAAEGQHVTAALPQIVQWFKTMTTNAYIRGVRTEGWPAFAARLWQRDYYEHIIRDDDEYARIWEYITNNPAQWASDRENPMATSKGTPDPWHR